MARSASSGVIGAVARPGELAPSATVSGAEQDAVMIAAAWHSVGWLLIANLIGVWLAVLLLAPDAGRWLGEWSYGRWMPVHLNFQLYGWIALPLVGWAIRLYEADRAPFALWSRTALIAWSLSLSVGGWTWLNGTTSGKLFLDWSGYTRVLFPLSMLYLWCVLATAYARSRRGQVRRSSSAQFGKVAGLVLLLLVPFLLYRASSPTIYPAINPDTGGPTGASQLESTLVVVLILFLLPYGLTVRKATPTRWISVSWIVFAVEAVLCLGLGRADVSHHQPVQFVSLGSLLVWVALVPAYFSAFRWPRPVRPWLLATFAWWGFLVPTGWAFFLPGILDRLKFTDGLVAHSLLAMAGFVTSLLVVILVMLADREGHVFNSRWAFMAWHSATFAYVVLFLFAGWREGQDPAFTMAPGVARNMLYDVRLVLGVAMTAASAQWFRQITRRVREGAHAVPRGLRERTERHSA